MKYIYKTVSVDEFITDGSSSFLHRANKIPKGKAPGKGIDSFAAVLGDDTTFAKNISEVLDLLLNYYGEDGWEYWQTIELSVSAMKTARAKAMGNIADNLFKGTVSNPEVRKYPIVIFRKAMAVEEHLTYKKEQELISAPESTKLNGGVMFCAECGAKNEGTARFCASCGAKV